jgi:ribosome-associated protein
MADQTPEPTTDNKPIDISGLPRRRTARTKAEREAARRGGYEPDQEALALARRIVDLAADKKAADIVLLEIGGLTSLADYFVICSGSSERQLGAIVDGIASALREEGIKPIGREGSASAHWMLLDYGSVIVHVMAPPERDFYQLERLWAEAPLLVRLV